MILQNFSKKHLHKKYTTKMQITNETTTASVNDYLALSIYIRNSSATTLDNQAIRIDIAPYLALSGDPEVLLQRMAEKLTGGVISSELEAEALAMINTIPQISQHSGSPRRFIKSSALLNMH